jgi:hypothetical protein
VLGWLDEVAAIGAAVRTGNHCAQTREKIFAVQSREWISARNHGRRPISSIFVGYGRI